jgi:hypothetical protein
VFGVRYSCVLEPAGVFSSIGEPCSQIIRLEMTIFDTRGSLAISERYTFAETTFPFCLPLRMFQRDSLTFLMNLSEVNSKVPVFTRSLASSGQCRNETPRASADSVTPYPRRHNPISAYSYDGQLVLFEHGQNVSMPCRFAHSAISRMVSVHGRKGPDYASAWSSFPRDS